MRLVFFLMLDLTLAFFRKMNWHIGSQQRGWACGNMCESAWKPIPFEAHRLIHPCNYAPERFWCTMTNWAGKKQRHHWTTKKTKLAKHPVQHVWKQSTFYNTYLEPTWKTYTTPLTTNKQPRRKKYKHTNKPAELFKHPEDTQNTCKYQIITVNGHHSNTLKTSQKEKNNIKKTNQKTKNNKPKQHKNKPRKPPKQTTSW